MALRAVVALLATAVGTAATYVVPVGDFDLPGNGLNASLCQFAALLEGTALLPGHSCCNGQLTPLGTPCTHTNPQNANLTYLEEDAVKLTDCEHKVPSALLVMRSTADVAKTVKFLTHFSLAFTTRSGGHAQSCSSTCHNCIVISLLHMKSIEQVSGGYSNNQYLVAQPGVTLAEAYEYYSETDFMILHGVMPTVALGGHYLGGGMGYFTRMHGFGTDYIVGAELVLADGRVVTEFDFAYELELRGYFTFSRDRALLWALRGSGHVGLGIVTKYWIKMIERPRYMVSGTAKYNASSVEDLKAFWTAMCEHYGHPRDEAPEARRLLVWPRMLPILDFLENSPVTLRFDYWYVPENDHSQEAALEEGIPVVDAFLEKVPAAPIAKTTTSGLSKDIHVNILNPPAVSGEGSCVSKNVMSKVDVCENMAWLDDVATRMHQMTPVQNWMGIGEHFYVVFEAWGGAAATNDPYHLRSSMSSRDTWGTFSYCRWPLSPQVPRERLLGDLAEFNDNVLEPISDVYYLNYADRRVEDIRQLYPQPLVYHRLRVLKQIYDPTNVFNSDSSLPSIPTKKRWGRW